MVPLLLLSPRNAFASLAFEHIHTHTHWTRRTQQVARGSDAGLGRDVNLRTVEARDVSATPSARERKGNWAPSVVRETAFYYSWLDFFFRLSELLIKDHVLHHVFSLSLPIPTYTHVRTSPTHTPPGTDGRTYRHVCRLMKKKCTSSDPLLSVAYRGECKGKLREEERKGKGKVSD